MTRQAVAVAAEPASAPRPTAAHATATQATAPAKINLYLHVLGRRADGLHLLDSLVGFAAVGDTLTLDADAALGLTLGGPQAGALAGEADNLVLRAARWLAQRAGRPAAGHFHLDKQLPVASGIGGGSADAACALRLLSRAWGLDVAEVVRREPAALAAALGADLPVCLAGTASFVGGIGEALTPVPDLPTLPAVLLHPGVALATGAMFGALGARYSPAARFDVPPDAATLIELLAARHNDLQAPATESAPAVAEALALLGAYQATRLARMSGSGATCFGLYDDDAAAAATAAALRAARPHWWVMATRIGGAAC